MRAAVPLRLVLVPALAVAVLTGVMLLLAQWLLVGEMERRTFLRSQHRAATVAQELDTELRSALREVQLLARAARPEAGRETLRADLDHLLRHSSQFVWLGLVSLDGEVLVGSQGWLEGRSIATRPVFRQSLGGTFVGDTHPAVALADLMARQGKVSPELLDIGEPVRDAQGRVVAVLAAHLGLDWVERLQRMATGDAQSTTPVPALTVHVLSGRDGRNVLANAPPPAGVPRHVPRPSMVRDLAGHSYIAASAEIGDAQAPGLLPWRVLVLQERAAALGPAWRVMRSMALLGGLSAVLVGLGSVWASRRLLRPWGPLFDAVVARKQTHGGAAGLAEDVGALLRDIESQRSGHGLSGPEALLVRLAQDASDLRRIVDHLPNSVVLIDAGYRVQYLNPSFTRLLGWTTDQVRGRIGVEFLFDAVERAGFVGLLDLLDDPPSAFDARFFALTPGADRVPVHLQFVPMLDPQGRLAGALALLHDIRPELAARARADAMAGRLRALADAAIDELLSTLDAEGRVLEWSRGAEHLTGLVPAAALGRPIGTLLGVPEPIDDVLIEARRAGHCAVSWSCALGAGRTRRFQGSVYALGLAPGTARFGILLRDLTEQHAVHQALERSEAHMRLAVDAARIGTWELDMTRPSREVIWSDNYAQTFGLPRHRLPQTAEAFYTLVHPDDHAAVRQAMLDTLRHDAPLRLAFRLRADDSWRWHEIHGRAVRGSDGRALRIGGIGVDITERRLAEAELRAGRERLEQIVRTMAEGLVTLDAEGRYSLVNPATERIVGQSAAKIIGRRYDQVSWRRMTPQGRPQTPSEHAFARLSRGEAPIHGEVVALQPAEGALRITSLNAQPILTDDGRFDGAVLTFVDITDRWYAERALADSQARLAAVVDGASDAIIATDLEHRISLFNPAAERIFGYRAHQLLGQPVERVLLQNPHLEPAAASDAGSPPRGPAKPGHVRGLHASGRTLELEASISQSHVGGETMLTAILRDIGERLEHERALELTRLELAQLNRRLLEQEKETTRRLAQALHDELGQTLGALRLNWDAYQHATEPLRELQAERIGLLVATANRQIRSVLGALRPPLLDEMGLLAALDNEVRQQRPIGGVPQLRLQAPDRLADNRWLPDIEYAAFMVGREALVNALQHAQAQTIEITLDGDAGELHLQVRDDGIGIPDDVREGRVGHLGLVGMRERARAIGARLDLVTTAGRGTTVELGWSLADEITPSDSDES